MLVLTQAEARKVWHRTLTGTEAITGEVAWLKEAIYGGRNVKPCLLYTSRCV